MAANIHAGEPQPVELPGTDPWYATSMAQGGKEVNPYGDLTAAARADAAMWPGILQLPLEHHVDQANRHSVPPNEAYVKTSDIDRTVGGLPGMTNRLPYTVGVVSTDAVENFQLTGRQIRIRRQPENQWGPAQGGAAGQQALHAGIAQQAIPDVPDWLAQSGIAEVI